MTPSVTETRLGQALARFEQKAVNTVYRDLPTLKLAHFARDPFALADEGHAQILDLQSLRPSTLDLWPHQREIIAAWVDIPHLEETGELRFRNLHEEKSRQMGVTWVVAYILHWAVAYHGVPLLAISRKLGEVCDPGFTTDSIFGRIRYLWQRTPDEIRTPLIFSGGNDPSIRNPVTGGFIAGEGAVLDPGRGGKYAAVFLDEAARIPWGRTVHAAVSRACPEGRLYNSTPRGEDDLYYWLRTTKPAGYTFLRHHWRVHPVYGQGAHIAGEDDDCLMCQGNRNEIAWNPSSPQSHRYPGRLASPWYDRAVVELTNEQVAEELDIDYSGSLPARVYSEFNEELHVLSDIPYDPLLPIKLSFDYGWEMNAVGIWQVAPTHVAKIGEFEGPDMTPDIVANGIRSVLAGLGVEARNLAHHNTITWECVGDPAGDAHNLATGRPLTADYRAQGFNITSYRRPIDQTIIAVKRLLIGQPVRMYLSAKGCPASITHFKNNRWPVDRAGNRKPNQREPLNDVHNHMLRADSYLLSSLYPPPDMTAMILDVHTQWVGTGHMSDDLPRYDDVL